ncbi:MAG: hypothetical protein U1E36_02065 [Rickettsiales bacterium]
MEPEMAAFVIAHNTASVGEGTWDNTKFKWAATKAIWNDSKGYQLVDETIEDVRENWWGGSIIAPVLSLLNMPATLVALADIAAGWTTGNEAFDNAYNKARSDAAKGKVIDNLKEAGFPEGFANDIGTLITNPAAS